MLLRASTMLLLALAACQGADSDHDRPDDRAEMRMITLAHADAAELVALLDESLAPDESVRYVADARTNSMIVSGSEEALARLLDTIALLDVPAEG